MFKFLAASALLAALCAPAIGQTVASCPNAVPGTVWATTPPSPAKTFLPCTVPLVYVAQPLTASGVVNDMRCTSAGVCTFSWMLASAILPTDQIWAKTATAPAGTWVRASTLIVTPAAPPPAPAPYTAPATLSWAAPTANTDGTPLTNLAGFSVYRGPSATSLTKFASVGPAVLTYATPIGVGTTYFAVTAFNSATPVAESAQSAVVSKSLAAPTAAVPNPPVLSP